MASLVGKGLKGWGIYGLNGRGIYDLNGWGIYGSNGWGSYGKVSDGFLEDMLQKTLVFRGVCNLTWPWTSQKDLSRPTCTTYVQCFIWVLQHTIYITLLVCSDGATLITCNSDILQQ